MPFATVYWLVSWLLDRILALGLTPPLAKAPDLASDLDHYLAPGLPTDLEPYPGRYPSLDRYPAHGLASYLVPGLTSGLFTGLLPSWILVKVIT